MAANKTTPTKLSVNAFIDSLPDQAKRSDAKALVKLMQDATGEKAKMWGPSIIGCGTYHYTYDSGREGDMPVVGFSPRTPAIVLYNLKAAADHEALLPIKRLADIDQSVLETLIVNSVAATRAR